MTFETSSLTKIGGRMKNEDYCRHIELGSYACWIVADGLGGHDGGDIASRTAVEAIVASFTKAPEASEGALEKYIADAHAAIKSMQVKDRRFSSMRTTIVIMVSDNNRVLWAHVGDSRLYCFSDERLTFQTRDNSVAQAMVNAGEINTDEIRFNEDRNRLLKVLGEKGTPQPTIGALPQGVKVRDAFLLCTDGLWEFVIENEMEADLNNSGSAGEWLGKMEKRLLERVDGRNDNYTAIAVCIR